MPDLPKPTAVERVTGSLPVESGLTALAAAVGTPIAALLPVLSKSIAAKRQKDRVDSALRQMNDVLGQHSEELQRLTDGQYKLINEAVAALLQTTHEGKMDYLKRVVTNSLNDMQLEDQDVVFLSRMVRDISADEAKFLVANFQYKRLWLNDSEPSESELPTLAVKPQSTEGKVVLGLITLGLATTAEPTFDSSGYLQFTPMAAKLIALLKDTEA